MSQDVTHNAFDQNDDVAIEAFSPAWNTDKISTHLTRAMAQGYTDLFALPFPPLLLLLALRTSEAGRRGPRIGFALLFALRLALLLGLAFLHAALLILFAALAVLFLLLGAAAPERSEATGVEQR